MVFFCSGISVVFFLTLGFSGCHNTFLSGISVVFFLTLRFSGCHNTFLSSPNFLLIIGRIRDLFVPDVDSLTC